MTHDPMFNLPFYKRGIHLREKFTLPKKKFIFQIILILFVYEKNFHVQKMIFPFFPKIKISNHKSYTLCQICLHTSNQYFALTDVILSSQMHLFHMFPNKTPHTHNTIQVLLIYQHYYYCYQIRIQYDFMIYYALSNLFFSFQQGKVKWGQFFKKINNLWCKTISKHPQQQCPNNVTPTKISP